MISNNESISERPQIVSTIEQGVFYGVELLADVGFLDRRLPNELEVQHRRRERDSDPGLQLPVKRTIGRMNALTIYWQNAQRYREEFVSHMPNLTDTEVDKLCVFFSSSVALGGMALEHLIRTKARTPAISHKLHELLSDKSDFASELVDEFGSKVQSRTMQNISDTHINEINGMRAALTIVRSAYQQRDGCDPVTDEAVIQCNEAFLDYVRNDSVNYTDLSKGLAKSEVLGIDVFSYAIPEWLPVLGFPMKPEKIKLFLDTR